MATAQAGRRLPLDSRRKQLAHILSRHRRGGELALTDHRIGQDKEVHVYRLVAEGTIEEKVMQLKESKAALFDAVVGEGEFASAAVTAEDVRELFALPEEKDAR